MHKIVLSEEQDVDAGHGGDLRNVLDAGSGFHLQRDDAVVVEVAGVSQQAGLVHAALRKIDRARADGRILGATHRLARFFGGVDVGDENAVGAHVEGLLNSRDDRRIRRRAPGIWRRHWRFRRAWRKAFRSPWDRVVCPRATSRSRCGPVARRRSGCARSGTNPSWAKPSRSCFLKSAPLTVASGIADSS